MSDTDFESLALLVAQARRGDAASLAQLRRRCAGHAACAAPYRLRVGLRQVLQDVTLRTRRHLHGQFLPFQAPHPLLEGRAWTADALAQVCACAPLAQALQAAALAHYDALERQMLTQELDRSGQARLHRSRRALAAPGQPLWVNWVYSLPGWRLGELDAIVRRWLEAPLEGRHTLQRSASAGRHAQLRAAQLVAGLPLEVQTFIDVQLQPPRSGRRRTRALLGATVQEANERAAAMRLQLQFVAAGADSASCS